MFNKIIRKTIYTIFGDETYLRFISSVYLRMYRSGKLKNKYPELYFLPELVKNGYVCIDIGANLGYYTVPLAQLAGNSGKVYAVEPVPLFRKILAGNIDKNRLTSRVEIVPYALGDTDNKDILMGTPTVEGLMHHGYTKVITAAEQNISRQYTVKQFTPQTLFGTLERIDFIKCDVEGFEIYIIPHFKDLLMKFLPDMQIEICPPENRLLISNIMAELGYNLFVFNGKSLVPLSYTGISKTEETDFYFRHPSHL